jgi:hypothetical protein
MDSVTEAHTFDAQQEILSPDISFVTFKDSIWETFLPLYLSSLTVLLALFVIIGLVCALPVPFRQTKVETGYDESVEQVNGNVGPFVTGLLPDILTIVGGTENNTYLNTCYNIVIQKQHRFDYHSVCNLCLSVEYFIIILLCILSPPCLLFNIYQCDSF